MQVFSSIAALAVFLLFEVGFFRIAKRNSENGLLSLFPVGNLLVLWRMAGRPKIGNLLLFSAIAIVLAPILMMAKGMIAISFLTVLATLLGVVLSYAFALYSSGMQIFLLIAFIFFPASGDFGLTPISPGHAALLLLLGFISALLSFYAIWIMNRELAAKYGKGRGYAFFMTLLPQVAYFVLSFSAPTSGLGNEGADLDDVPKTKLEE